MNGIVLFSDSIGLHVSKLDYSPITGPEGNIEFLAEIIPKCERAHLIGEEEIHSVVSDAHRHLFAAEKHEEKPNPS